MKEVKYWLAEDNTMFDNEWDCRQYERQIKLKEHKNNFIFYDYQQKPIPIEQATTDNIYYILIKTPEAAECICDWYESDNCNSPFESYNFDNKVGLWFSGEVEDYGHSECWYKVEDEIERLQSLRKDFIKE